MTTEFYKLANVLIVGITLASCSTPRYVSMQSNDPYYNDPQPPPQQEVYNDNAYSQDQPAEDVDFNTFYTELSPYGTWENDPAYGQVWSCNDPSFTPYYSGGNWAYTDAGWAWVSSYNWGWAPFHYGRWAFTNRWVWVPGYEWAPAWVSWRSGGDYYGWAPLGPGMGVDVNIGYGNYMPAERWNFCRRAYIGNPNFTNYCLGRRENITIIQNTTIINNVNVYRNTRFVAGPERREVERYSGTRINAVAIRNAARPGATVIGTDGLRVYRPNVRPAENGRFSQNQGNGGRGNNYQPPFGQNNQPRPSSSYNRPFNSRAPQQNNNIVPGNTANPTAQPGYNGRPPYIPQQRGDAQAVPPQQAPQPVAPRYQPPVRQQYQAPAQQQRQPVYNYRPQPQPAQQQQPAPRTQYTPPPRSNNNGRPGNGRP